MKNEAKKQFMVIHGTSDGKERIVKMNIGLEEACALSKEHEFYAVANMFNWFENHDCKLSPDSGCKVCELLASIEEECLAGPECPCDECKSENENLRYN